MNPNKLLIKVKIYDFSIKQDLNTDFLIGYERLYLQVVNSGQPVFLDNLLIDKFKHNKYTIKKVLGITKEELKQIKEKKWS